MTITHAIPLIGYVTKPALKPISCGGCGHPPNHTKAYAIGKEIVHCSRCDREVIRPLGNDDAVREWNKINQVRD